MVGRRSNVTAPNPSGLCLCGYGEITPRAKLANSKLGHKAGEHIRYFGNHGTGYFRPREGHWNWSGGRRYTYDGYVEVRVDGKYVREHRLVMEKTLGRPLSPARMCIT